MEFLQQLLLGGVGAGIVAGIFKLAEWGLNRRATVEDTERERRFADCDARGREIESIQKTLDSLVVADRVVLYDRIKHLAKSHIVRGWISVEDYEDLTTMHQVYHDKLDGNGFLNTLMETVSQLEKRVT